MRTTILIAALAASGFTAAACTAQSAPQTAAQANRQVAGDLPPPPAAAGRGMGARGLMRADADGDGIVTRAEATAEADRRFAAIDANHDGRLTADEMQAERDAMRARLEARGQDIAPPPPGGAKHAPGIGRRADPDGDGAITKAEYEARDLARFDRIDADHDGRIDRTEIANLMEMRRERRGGMAYTPPPPPDE